MKHATPALFAAWLPVFAIGLNVAPADHKAAIDKVSSDGFVVSTARSRAWGFLSRTGTSEGGSSASDDLLQPSLLRWAGKQAGWRGALSLLQQHQHRHRRRLLRKRHQRHHRSLAFVSSSSTFGDQRRSFDDALKSLNEKVSEAFLNQDIETTRCAAYEESQRRLMELARQDLGLYSEQVAMSEIEFAQAQATNKDTAAKIPGLRERERDHLQSCQDQTIALHREAEVANSDSVAIATILSSTSCGQPGSALLALRRCQAQRLLHRPRPRRGSTAIPPGTGRRPGEAAGGRAMLLASSGRKPRQRQEEEHKSLQAHKKVPTVATATASLAEKISTAAIKTDSARLALTDVLRELDEEATTLHGRVSLFQTLQRRHRRHRLHLRQHKRAAHGRNGTSADSGARRLAKCTIPSLALNCQHIRGKVSAIQGETMDNHEQIKASLSDLQLGCSQARDEFRGQIESLEESGRTANYRMAASTAEGTMAREQLQLKQDEFTRLTADYDEQTTRCRASVSEMHKEVCGLQQVRGELGKLEGGGEVYFQDCQVSEWTHGECSAKCGGGHRRLTRSVVAPAVRGAACPPLELIQECGLEPCPVDCEMGSWDGWSTCTAQCNGGVRERVRRVLKLGSHGGRQCGATTDAEACNIQACDSDCTLTPWREWSACTKSCGGGTQQRTRAVQADPVGGGSCASPDSFARVRHQSCAQTPCEEELLVNGAEISLVCKEKLDIVILLDGGASAADAVGFFSFQEAAGHLVENLKPPKGTSAEDGPHFGVQVFGGALKSDKCMLRSGSGDVDLNADCGIQWLKHLPDPAAEKQPLKDKLMSFKFPGGTSLTSEALGAAESELLHGREDARSVVIIFSAGFPFSTQKTAQAAQRLKTKARVMWVAVMREGVTPDTSPLLQELEPWTSPPLSENLIGIRGGFSTLSKERTAKILAGRICNSEGLL
mmetsp:Transcript_102816/g.289147  ORF Transcript_102816/g.289147 Transcript_102816/m.289147 type:complete len:946 (+) Transcript_102816:95-2932(+)